uniref:valine--tRNA ligase n=1 Tax=Parascaris univalens TaxID=6257 RepID=A0A914ZKF4_PARUN
MGIDRCFGPDIKHYLPTMRSSLIGRRSVRIPVWKKVARTLSTVIDANEGKSSFDVLAVTADYERRTELAAKNRTDTDRRHVFRMVLPPPNVTGKLHLGHALTVTIEDAICRHKRIYGHHAIWHVGFDHAGIATQAIVERHLWKKSKLRRQNIPREQFLQLCNQWKETRIAEISNQLKRLGATLDWSNPYFTMDERFGRTVTIAFCRLYSEGLIFRERRLVNWCPTLQSTISDQEVDHIDVGQSKTISIPSMGSSKERSIKIGVMHHIRYELVEKHRSTEYLEVATTRPETTFADVALAVHPEDKRYFHLIGKAVRHPLMPHRIMRIIADESVKPNKGTGVLKITPSHDFVDLNIARHHKEEIDDEAMRCCIDEQGRLINAPGFNGLDRFEARSKIVDRLREIGAYGGESSCSDGQIPICSRTGDIVEPMMKEQWFLRCDEINDAILDALNTAKLHLTPNFLRVKLEEWLSNKEPWCLSRQLLWGHRIPAYRIANSKWIAATSEEEAQRIFGIEAKNGAAIIQDEDVLDTWFSSSLVPLVVAGWPENRLNSSPLSLMETGHDIVGFWVARMLTVCYRLSGCIPFTHVLLHGLVRDSAGRKMSKSLGNVIDPVDIIDGISIDDMIDRLKESSLPDSEKEVASSHLRAMYPNGMRRCGPDALRFALLRYDLTALDINVNISETAIEGLRFCNKLWNLCAYAKGLWSKARSVTESHKSLHPADRWIRSCLSSSLQAMNMRIDEGSVHLAFASIHKFILADLCDVYLETTKKALWNNEEKRIDEIAIVLREVIEKSLIAMSVFMPFVSEYLFEQITADKCVRIYDRYLSENELSSDMDNELERRMSIGLAIISTIRSLRRQLQLTNKIPLNVSIHSDTPMLNDVEAVICDLGNFSITSYNSFQSPIKETSLPVSVLGHSVVLGVELETEYSKLIHMRIFAQLEKAEQRRRQFEAKAEKYEKLCMNETLKRSILEKNRRKAAQARQVAMGMLDEIAKLRQLLHRRKETSVMDSQ